ncbi:Mss4-like protein [Cytidiella melzeri]|nr:Mss4-like protein [Cytidiella melzeri]
MSSADVMLHVSTEAHRTGSCLCGQISCEITGEPLFSTLCHCLNCKKSSGTGFTWNGQFKSNQIRFVKGESLLQTYEDSATVRGTTLQRKFCSNCGSSLIITSTQRADLAAVPVGVVDGDISDIWAPKVEVFCKDRSKWLPDLGCRRSETMPEQFAD